MLERRRKAKEAESQVRRRDKARSKELVQKGRDASETLLRLLETISSRLHGGSTWFKASSSG